MMFSTKAEYGVRVMVELARRDGDEPVPLAEIAEADGLPLAYLEHLVARLRKAGLVDCRRGSRGGYLLARPADEITMAEVVEALEGSIAPIECISRAPTASSSARASPTPTTSAPPSCCGRACASRSSHAAETRSRPAPARRPSRVRRTLRSNLTTGAKNMADLEIKNLHVRTEDREILRGVDLDIGRARSTR